MPLSDSVLELVLSFMLEPKPSVVKEEEMLTARSARRLLATRRTRGFEHVREELTRQGSLWAEETERIRRQHQRLLENFYRYGCLGETDSEGD